MRVLVTGARGFMGQNLVASLEAIRDGKDRRPQYQQLLPLEVMTSDVDTPPDQLLGMCARADAVVHLAGVNRPENDAEFETGNLGSLEAVLCALEAAGNPCPVVFSSSIQASLVGRYTGSAYGKSKLAAEKRLCRYGKKTGALTYVFRFSNTYGKWCRPNYNSVVATFCYNMAHGLPLQVNDPSVLLELTYIDDLVGAVLDALCGRVHRCDYAGVEPVSRPDGPFCYVPTTDRITVGELADMLRCFSRMRDGLEVPDCTDGSFEKKLYATYLSYLEPENLAYVPESHVDARGSFTELIRTADRGQVSVNVIKPGVTKGQHWYHTKWEKFVVVSGEGLIRERRVGRDGEGHAYPIVEWRVTGDRPTVVEMAPGYTHSITNTSATQDLVTLMWASECFDPTRPDTFHEEV